jgi:multidrug efflux pump subunit AcrA (membrane-fusion protein)
MVDPQTRTIKVQAELDNPGGRLRPEMFASVQHSHGSRSVPALPAAAIVRWQGGTAVFLQTAPGEFQRQEVSVGEPDGGFLPVLGGLKGGERVVADGAVLLGER